MAHRSIEQSIEPVRKAVTVRQNVEDAFRIFTDQIGFWWPLPSHSLSGERAVSCGIDGVVGGHVFEVLDGGARLTWGEVLVWEPPHRLAFTWQLDRKPEQAQNVEVTFAVTETGTRVELTHSGWERLGAEAKELRAGYNSGWEFVFVERYGDRCAQGAENAAQRIHPA